MTHEKSLKQIFYAFLLVVCIALLMWYILDTNEKIECLNTPIEDLHQQQEMIDYHRAQGREITINN